jgi:hypothetical protein
MCVYKRVPHLRTVKYYAHHLGFTERDGQMHRTLCFQFWRTWVLILAQGPRILIEVVINFLNLYEYLEASK